MHDPLRRTVNGTHEEVQAGLERVTSAIHERLERQAVVRAADAFLIQVCRHQGAVCDVLLPAVRDALPGGNARVAEYVHQARRVESAAAQAKSRIYGESRAMTMSWEQTWASLTTDLDRLHTLERAIVADLSDCLALDVRSELTERLESVEAIAPTRPHPHSPHTGALGHWSRALWSWADRVWDATEGRIVAGSTEEPPAAPDSLAS